MGSILDCVCRTCLHWNSFRDKKDNWIDTIEEDDFNGRVDCDKAKEYLSIENGVIKKCPGHE